MSNITKELSASKKADNLKLQQDNAVKAVLLLENKDSQEDLRIANALGAHNAISRAQTELGKKLEMEKLDKMYVGNVFTREQVQNLARKYNLRFLSSNNYCGSLDVEAISKLKEFSKQTDVTLADGNLKYNFFILAPEKCFNLNKVVKMKKDPDPALFYKVDDNHYRLIHQWGNDFNIFNRIAGMNWASRESKFCLSFVIGVIISVLITHSIFHFAYWLSGVCLIVPSLYALVNAFHDSIWDDQEFHDKKWNSTNKIYRNRG